MKTKLLLSFLFFANSIFAQSNIANEVAYNTVATSKFLLPITKNSVRGAYPLAISDDKTVHIVFPSQIKEVDAGAQYVITEITESFNNVLKVKSSCIDECKITSLTILTDDGGLYSFLVTTMKDPEILNINIGHNITSDQSQSQNLGINTFLHSKYLDTKTNQSAEMIKSQLITASQLNKKIKNVGIQYMYMSANLNNLSRANDLMIYTINLENHSEIDYKIDFVKMYIRDKSTAKKLAIQEEEVKVLQYYPAITDIPASTNFNLSIATDMITIASDKIVEVEIYEKNGGRHLRFPIDSKIISKAKNLSK